MYRIAAHFAAGDALVAPADTASDGFNGAATGVNVLLLFLLASVVIVAVRLAAAAIAPVTEIVKAYMGAISLMVLMLLLAFALLATST